RCFVLPCSGAHRHLHSFPTRRSSDLRKISPERIILADGAGAGNLCVPELIPLGINQSVHCYIPGTVSHYKVDWMQERTDWPEPQDRKSTRLNSSHVKISYAVFCLKKK